MKQYLPELISFIENEEPPDTACQVCVYVKLCGTCGSVGGGGDVRMIVRDTSEGRLKWRKGEVMSGERGEVLG